MNCRFHSSNGRLKIPESRTESLKRHKTSGLAFIHHLESPILWKVNITRKIEITVEGCSGKRVEEQRIERRRCRRCRRMKK